MARKRKAGTLFNTKRYSLLHQVLLASGTPGEKLALLEKLKAAGKLDGEDQTQLTTTMTMFRALAEMASDRER